MFFFFVYIFSSHHHSVSQQQFKTTAVVVSQGFINLLHIKLHRNICSGHVRRSKLNSNMEMYLHFFFLNWPLACKDISDTCSNSTG